MDTVTRQADMNIQAQNRQGATYEYPQDRGIRKTNIRALDSIIRNREQAIIVSDDGHRQIDVDGAKINSVLSMIMPIMSRGGMTAIEMGDLLDRAEQAIRADSQFARLYVESRVREEERDLLAKAIRMAPDGSGNRTAIRYLLATH